MDGKFTTDNEYRGALKHIDDLNVGYFYKQYVQDWAVGSITYNDTMTFFDLHYFFDEGYGQLDDYDLNSFKFTYGQTLVTTWVFYQGIILMNTTTFGSI